MARVFQRPGTLLRLAFALCCLATLQASGSSADLTYRSTVSEVRLTFFATDQMNRGVQSLHSDDFAVVDDGLVIRQFRSFSRSDVTALDIVLMVDVSASVGARYRQVIADVLQLIAQTPSLSEDQISVISFGGTRETVLCSGNCGDPSLARRLESVETEGTTPLYDALQFTGNFVAQRRHPDTRPVLIVFSDGNDTISMTSSNEALQTVVASEAQIYAIDLNDPRQPSNGVSVLETMAQVTGGNHFTVHQSAAGILQAVLEDLRAGYIVTYKLPTNATGFHSIRIQPTRDMKLKFRCRSGYVYQSANR